MGYQNGLFSWADVSSPDPATASKFYTGLFGWDADDQYAPDGSYIYTMFRQDGKAVAGLGQQPQEMTDQGIPPMWSSYVSVDDIDAAVAKWTEAGGSVMMPTMDVMTSGRMAILVDPEGAVLSLWQAGDHLGAEVFNKPGTMTWNELSTRDSAAAMDFYGKAIGWTFEAAEGPEPRYWMLTIPSKIKDDPVGDDDYNGGILTMDANFPPNVPAYWGVYFAVADTDASVAKALELGGNVVAPPMDISAGRLAVVADPQGGTFVMIAAPTAS